MARRLLAGVVVAAALGAAGAGAADQGLLLRSATAVHRHVVVRVSVGDLRPIDLAVATRRAVNADGGLLQKNVRLRETIQIPASQTGVVRWRSHETLRPGTYFVQVKAVQTVDVLDCPPKLHDCNERWSNVRRIVVPRPT
jgi:hypothetical protein